MARSGSRFALAALPLAMVFAASAQQAPPAEQQSVSGRDRVVITGMVPIPNVGAGAAYYTPEELKKQKSDILDDQRDATVGARRCKDPVGNPDTRIASYRATMERVFRAELEAANIASSRAGEAAQATEVAEKLRRDAAEGRASKAEVEEAELARQRAVNNLVEAQNKLQFARLATDTAGQLYAAANIYKDPDPEKYARMISEITWSEIDFRANAAQLRIAKAEKEWEGLAITDVHAGPGSDRKGGFLLVTGTIRSSRAKPAVIPDLQIAAFDAKGFVLKTQVAEQSTRGRIPAAGFVRFRYELRPLPDAIERAAVTFIANEAPPPRLSVNLLCPA